MDSLSFSSDNACMLTWCANACHSAVTIKPMTTLKFPLLATILISVFDASTIDLCLSVFAWAPPQATKAAIKPHTLLDLRGKISIVIHITDRKTHEVTVLDDLML